jgi:putative thioredoxin
MSQGLADEAMARLVDAVRYAAGADRETARARLLEYFTMLGPEDPRVVTARRALARALF